MLCAVKAPAATGLSTLAVALAGCGASHNQNHCTHPTQPPDLAGLTGILSRLIDRYD